MEQSNSIELSNREVKSSTFTTFFSIPENAAALYSALEGVPVGPEDIDYATLEGILFIKRKNDLAFTVKNKVLIISEHQSTINENMPLRDAIYYGRTIEKLLVDPGAVYRQKRIMIPTPKFFVFYNGNKPFPPEKILKLSDAYLEKLDTPMLELIVKVININLSTKHELLELCRPLYEYSWFIQRVKDYESNGTTRDDAITQAIRDCKKEDIMTEFMYEHGSEVANMLFGEYDEELAKAIAREEGYEDGFEAGKLDGMEAGMQAGELQLLLQQISTKMSKQKSADVIAAELESDINLVHKIYIAIQQYGTQISIEQLLELLNQ